MKMLDFMDHIKARKEKLEKRKIIEQKISEAKDKMINATEEWNKLCEVDNLVYGTDEYQKHSERMDQLHYERMKLLWEITSYELELEELK